MSLEVIIFFKLKNLANIHFLKVQRNSELSVDFSWEKKKPQNPIICT